MVQIAKDRYLEAAEALDAQALAIYEDVKNLTPEKMEEAERLTAAAMKSRASNADLIEIEKRRQVAMGEIEDNDPETPAPDVEKALKDTGGYATLGHWFRALYNFKRHQIMSSPGLVYWDGESDDGRARLRPIKDAKALAENVGATGGFLVPAEFQARLLTVMAEQTIVRPRAQIIRMNRRTVSIPALSQSEVVAGGFNWFGGIKTYYAPEGGQKGESQPSFRQITLTAHKMVGYVATSDELIDDSAISLQDFLMGELGFPGAMAKRADFDYLQGTGAGQPQGIINADATIVHPRAAANAIGYEDLTGMLAKAMTNTQLVWVISKSAQAQLLNMQGPSGNPLYLWANAVSGAPNTLLGYPVIFTDSLPALGTQGDVLLAAFSYYLIGDRQATTMDMSMHELFRTDQTSWRAFMRHDGQPWLDAPISYGFGEEIGQISPFVVLGDVVT